VAKEMMMSAFRMAFILAGALAAVACGGDREPAVAARAAAVATSVPVAALGARACDLVLDVGNDPVAEVRFAAGVAGSHFRRAPLLAVSLTSLSDEALPDAPFVIEAALPLSPRVVSQRCVDRLGQPLTTTDESKDL
jgi:hypothetical protein